MLFYMPDWNARAYDRLSVPQQEWGEATMGRLELGGDETLVDVGCGTGRLTERLLERLPRGRVVALDHSIRMLQVATTNLRPRFAGRVWFVRADGAALPLRGAADVIFSAATFHWILDHDRLFRSLHAALAPGGRLVAQCGGGPNLARLIARMSALAAEPAYARFFEGWRDPWLFEDAETAARRLRAAGFDGVETSTHPAPVTFSTREEFEDFVACVCARHHLARLPAAEHQPFVSRLSALAAGDDPPFTLDYWRLNLRGRRAG
jgi:trans-aconitate 2-methyltransferase